MDKIVDFGKSLFTRSRRSERLAQQRPYHTPEPAQRRKQAKRRRRISDDITDTLTQAVRTVTTPARAALNFLVPTPEAEPNQLPEVPEVGEVLVPETLVCGNSETQTTSTSEPTPTEEIAAAISLYPNVEDVDKEEAQTPAKIYPVIEELRGASSLHSTEDNGQWIPECEVQSMEVEGAPEEDDPHLQDRPEAQDDSKSIDINSRSPSPDDSTDAKEGGTPSEGESTATEMSYNMTSVVIETSTDEGSAQHIQESSIVDSNSMVIDIEKEHSVLTASESPNGSEDDGNHQPRLIDNKSQKAKGPAPSDRIFTSDIIDLTSSPDIPLDEPMNLSELGPTRTSPAPVERVPTRTSATVSPRLEPPALKLSQIYMSKDPFIFSALPSQTSDRRAKIPRSEIRVRKIKRRYYGTGAEVQAPRSLTMSPKRRTAGINLSRLRPKMAPPTSATQPTVGASTNLSTKATIDLKESSTTVTTPTAAAHPIAETEAKRRKIDKPISKPTQHVLDIINSIVAPPPPAMPMPRPTAPAVNPYEVKLLTQPAPAAAKANTEADDLRRKVQMIEERFEPHGKKRGIEEADTEEAVVEPASVQDRRILPLPTPRRKLVATTPKRVAEERLSQNKNRPRYTFEDTIRASNVKSPMPTESMKTTGLSGDNSTTKEWKATGLTHAKLTLDDILREAATIQLPSDIQFSFYAGQATVSSECRQLVMTGMDASMHNQRYFSDTPNFESNQMDAERRLTRILQEFKEYSAGASVERVWRSTDPIV
ncbi:uncharacterized protein SPPG_08098 [Spizellomyces punctatus DAOM BR117]|uniref:Uncharacterized protein n=1 Tax=Spizellomyces punctatus (strain DAOM BR117) TaxID=645134 RepID=A0A0L0H6B0_SPIPD|nr:uncharacterized protein SPPG_08098 [Spizellomyces punctatus DAOM BR117]KNC96509.1 hypothetical protein SPPG_08098 [Spizellomyces punctatus DAOM BR117]|eukprot:XP_016604549.1 hypothetical protein SPPG_08098 [Spizellomyces punctatus DAOM BR117]